MSPKVLLRVLNMMLPVKQSSNLSPKARAFLRLAPTFSGRVVLFHHDSRVQKVTTRKTCPIHKLLIHIKDERRRCVTTFKLEPHVQIRHTCTLYAAAVVVANRLSYRQLVRYTHGVVGGGAFVSCWWRPRSCRACTRKRQESGVFASSTYK